MKKEKIVISLIVMFIVLAVLSISVFATEDSNNQVITINAGTSNTSSDATAGATTISPTSNSATNNRTATITAANSNNTANSTEQNTANTSSNVANSSTTSSYRNTSTSNTNNSSLPYTGSNYSIVFVVIALVISAVYAYKKVSDYNM